MVICIAVFTSAQIGKTVLLKRTVSFFFIFPKDVKKRKSWVNAVNRTDWSPHEIFSNFIMFGAFVDGWHSHSVSDDPVFSYNEKYRTDWICRWLICPLLCQHAINLEKLQVFLKYSWQRSWRKKLLWTHSAIAGIGHESGLLQFFLSLDWQHENLTFLPCGF